MGALPLLAQRERDNWFMSNNMAINFPLGGNPTEIVGGSQIPTLGVNTTVSDSITGQLLFYTNGKTVWNKNNQVMDNGNSIITNAVASYVITCPIPRSAGQYYIFSHGDAELKYAVVDMQQNAGMGKVISTNNLLSNVAFNRFTIVKHKDPDAYWLVTFRGSFSNDTFECYPITSAGIQPPVRSVFGVVNLDRTMGDLICNNAGDKIAITFHSATSPAVFVYPISKGCGTLSLPKKLPLLPNSFSPGGAAFSKNDSKLYVTFLGSPSKLIQYSGTDFTGAVEVTSSNKEFYDIKLAPNGKMYVSKGLAGVPTGLWDIINFPDLNLGPLGYNVDAFSKGANQLLPIFSADFSIPGAVGPQPVVTVQNTCITDTTIFTPSGLPFLDSLVWDFGEPTSGANNTSKSDISSHIYGDTGTYTVTLSWYLCGVKTSVNKQVQIITVPKSFLGNDTVLCHKATMQLSTQITNATLLWSTGANDSAIQVSKPGVYWLRATVGPRCKSTDSIWISYKPEFTVDFFDTTYYLCEDLAETITLQADTGYTYLWLPSNETTPAISAAKTGLYWVTVTDKTGCTARDSALVESLCDNTFILPTAFTPGHDGLNDFFMPVYSEITDYKMEIFSQWGQKVFETTNPNQGWDGKFKDWALPTGVYVWKVRYNGNFNKIERTYYHKGIVTLIN